MARALSDVELRRLELIENQLLQTVGTLAKARRSRDSAYVAIAGVELQNATTEAQKVLADYNAARAPDTQLYCPGCGGPPVAPFQRNDSWGVGTACGCHPGAGILLTKKDHDQRLRDIDRR